MLSLAALLLGFSPGTPDTAREAWNSWKSQHGKAYSASESEARYASWRASSAEVDVINSRNGGWSAALNEFSDLTWDEFRASRLMTPQNCSATHTRSGWHAVHDAKVPKSIDWRVAGALNAVKNQGHCGSCWTFSSTGAMESHYFLKCVRDAL